MVKQRKKRIQVREIRKVNCKVDLQRQCSTWDKNVFLLTLYQICSCSMNGIILIIAVSYIFQKIYMFSRYLNIASTLNCLRATAIRSYTTVQYVLTMGNDYQKPTPQFPFILLLISCYTQPLWATTSHTNTYTPSCVFYLYIHTYLVC